MKIAVAVFGIPRGAGLTYAPMMERVVRQAEKVGQVRLFGHLFELSQVVNERSGESGAMDRRNYEAFSHFDLQLEPPRQCLDLYALDALKAFGDFYEDDFKSLANLIHQLHSLKMVTQRIESYEPDAVIFARPDLLYHDDFPSWMMRNAARHPRRCFLPHWQWWGGYNDRLAVCGREAYLHYGKRVDQLLRYCQDYAGPVHAERLLRDTLRRQQVELRHLPVRASRVRVGDVVKPESFATWSTAGPRRRWAELAMSQMLTRMRM